jgi:hypothetical protein
MKFDEFCGRLSLGLDMNGDYQTTITDVIEWCRFVWLLPAKLLMLVFDNFLSLHVFFESNCDTGNSFGGFVFSTFVWWIIYLSFQDVLTKSKQ